ncbi:MAG: sulfoxide reductase heme-binding subunit YedZ [Alphaproteobacteria bacterium]|nr:MAG: sulfoxide reductase heme-binding subunit YedZ [Alphaproteobacteria bacterium]
MSRRLEPFRYVLSCALFLAALAPAAGLVWLATTGGLGAEPIKATIHYTGNWTLRFLMIVLAITPLYRMTEVDWIMRQRRMMGLFAYFYAVLHMLSYLGLDQFFDWPLVGEDVVKRPFITIGMVAFFILTLLALTSSRSAVRRIGARRWQALHRLVYGAALLGGLHFLIGVKADVTEPVTYLALIAALLALRLVPAHRFRALRRRLAA